MNRKRRLKVQDFNPHLICVLCRGYFIDATTVIECLHSFCRACIVQYLYSNRFCPICDVQIHKSKPLQNIRKDTTLQDLVYKLVPGLFQNELRNRREFSSQHPELVPYSDLTDSTIIYTPDECFSLTLEYWKQNNENETIKQEPKCSNDGDVSAKNIQPDDDQCSESTSETSETKKRYLRCPAAVTVAHLHKLVRAKYGLHSSHLVELLYRDEPLHDQLTLIDVAYIFNWRRKGSLNLTYRIFESYKRRKHEYSSACIDSHSQLGSLKNDESEINSPKKLINTEDLTEKVSDWKEVQLQISETGIMSVTGISLEHNNNVTNGNNNNNNNTTLEKSSAKEPKSQPTAVISAVSPPDCLESPITHIGDFQTNNLKLDLCAANVDPGVTPTIRVTEHDTGQEEKHTDSSSIASNYTDRSVSKESKDPLLNPIAPSQIIECHDARNAGSESLKCESQRKRSASYNSILKHPKDIGKTSASKQSETLDLSPKHNIYSKVPKITTSSVALDVKSCHLTNNSSTKTNIKTFATVAPKLETGIHPGNALKPERPRDHCTPNKDKDIQYYANPTCLPPQNMKKSSSSNSMGYKTLKVPPKTWNPSITRSSYLQSKTHNSILESNTNNNSNTNPVKAAEKAPKFFKMRNMPRYLGNPASGVKPMYQVATDTKTQESGSVMPSKQVVMKIDPKTLSPIISASSSSAISVSSTQSKSFYSLPTSSPVDQSVTTGRSSLVNTPSGTFDSSKKSPRRKSNSPDYSNQVLAPKTLTVSSLNPVSSTVTTLTSSSAPSNVNYPRTGSTASPSTLHTFGNARSPNMTAGTTSSNLLLKSSGFAINPATLNLLSSNLSFLPNASNFLYGNYSSYPPPSIRSGLNSNSSLGVGPASASANSNLGIVSGNMTPGLGAFHSMPPSINMLFPHHRSGDRSSGFSTNANHAPTPAVQRIPASKVNNNSNVGYSMANQNSPSQSTSRNHSTIKSTRLVSHTNNNDNNLNDALGHKQGCSHKAELCSHDQPILRLEVNLNNNAAPVKMCKIKACAEEIETGNSQEAKLTIDNSRYHDSVTGTQTRQGMEPVISDKQVCSSKECIDKEVSLKLSSANNISTSTPNRLKIIKEETATRVELDSLLSPTELVVKIDAGDQEIDETPRTDNNRDLKSCVKNNSLKESHTTIQNKDIATSVHVALEVKTGT